MSYKIPLFDLNFDKVEEKAVIETLRSKWISTGPKTQEFEKKFANMLGAEFALATSNCTVALHLAMIMAEVGQGDEVICPSLTFIATVNAIRYVGAKPVFADIKSYENLNIDPEDIIKKVTDKTKAIVVMHYGGFACDMDEIMAISKKYGLKVIEDSCHGPLSEYNEKKLGTIGDMGCFSFFSNKNLSTGEGGMLVTNNKKYFDKAKLLRSHGMTSLSYERSKDHSDGYDVIDLGYNYRMDDIRASIGIAQLGKLANDIRKRAAIRKIYVESLKDTDEIIIPFRNYQDLSSNHIFPIVLKNSNYKNRDLIRRKLSNNGIQTSMHYPAVNLFLLYREKKVSLPKTEYVSDNEITLPLYSTLSSSNINYICKTLKEVTK